MTNQEILTKAIEKAIANGYDTKSENLESVYRLIIFNHDFAKSLWPEQYGVSGSVDPRAVSPSTARPLIPTWQARLMEMVVSEDPIKYLGENLDF